MKSAFIVLEGLEGAGKSTVMQIVIDFFESKQHKVIQTREPGGTPMAESIRDCVKKSWSSEQVTQETELLLMYAARSQLFHNIIQPALSSDCIVIGDRHNLSSIAYQGGGRGIPMEYLRQLTTMTMGDFEPNLTIYLDIDPVVGLGRASKRGELDRIEQSDLNFFNRARHCFQREIERLQREAPGSAVSIDASQSPNNVKQDVLAHLTQWYKQNQSQT